MTEVAGKCPKCGKPMGHSCPHCGWNPLKEGEKPAEAKAEEKEKKEA